MTLLRTIRAGGIAVAARAHLDAWRVRDRTPRLLILCYHGVRRQATAADWLLVPDDQLARQLEWTHRHFLVLPVDDAVEALTSGKMDRPIASVTFDDGYANNIDVGLPVLARFRTPSTIYLATGLLGTAERLWTVRLRAAVEQTDARWLSAKGLAAHIKVPMDRGGRARMSARLKSLLAPMPKEARLVVLEELVRCLGEPDLPHEAFGFLDGSRLDRAASTGLVTFGGHTVTHEILRYSNDQQVSLEVSESVSAIAAMGLPQSKTFAYPNGQPEDFDERACTAVRSAGCIGAVTTVGGFNFMGSDPLRLRRMLVPGQMSFDEFRVSAAGLIK